MPTDLIDLSGVVRLRRDLLADGYSDKQIAASTRRGALTRIRHGAYVDGDTWSSLCRADRHRLRARAVLRTAHPDTVLSHVSSLLERGVPVWGVDLGTVHTTRTTHERAGRRQRDWVPHRSALPEGEVETVNGVRVTCAPRAALELATTTGVEEALVPVNALLHAGHMTQADFDAFVKQCAHWPHSLTADLVVRLAEPLAESPGESRAYFMCWKQGLPRPVPQVVVRDESGEVFARLDLAWPSHGVFLEFDGREKYDRFRRDGESLEDYLMREKRREEEICALTGWVCIRITWADLAQPELTAARIRRLLESRAPLGA